jgi:predicted ferric reductase
VLYLAFVLAPLLVPLVEQGPASGDFRHELAAALGATAMTMMAAQFLLTARFRRPTPPYGIDVVYYCHRYLAVVALAFLVAHSALLVASEPGALRGFDPRTAPWSMTAGVLSALGFLVLVGSSVWRRRLRLEYDAWRVTHAALAVVSVALGFAHIHGIGRAVASPAQQALWLGIGGLVLVLVVRVRLVRPWQLLRTPYEVASVEPARGDAWTLALVPKGHAGFAFEPGQFAWVTLRHSPFAMREHPFSISSCPVASGRLEITVKELGDFTRTVGRVVPGETAYVDGPYGAFTLGPNAAHGACFVGGGIGLAPIVSMLRALAERGDSRPLLLVAACSTWERATFRDAIEALGPRLPGLRVVHVLEAPPPGWTGEVGRVDAALLERHLPRQRDELEYFVCGPPPMTEAVERALAALGIPAQRCHSELFDLV